MHLEERLVRFKGTTNEKDLYAFFNELAQGFLYGGYIQVRNEYRIYIRTVEFYFHSEELDGIHDPIIYHRNIRDKEGNMKIMIIILMMLRKIKNKLISIDMDIIIVK